MPTTERDGAKDNQGEMLSPHTIEQLQDLLGTLLNEEAALSMSSHHTHETVSSSRISLFQLTAHQLAYILSIESLINLTQKFELHPDIKKPLEIKIHNFLGLLDAIQKFNLTSAENLLSADPTLLFQAVKINGEVVTPFQLAVRNLDANICHMMIEKIIPALSALFQNNINALQKFCGSRDPNYFRELALKQLTNEKQLQEKLAQTPLSTATQASPEVTKMLSDVLGNILQYKGATIESDPTINHAIANFQSQYKQYVANNLDTLLLDYRAALHFLIPPTKPDPPNALIKFAKEMMGVVSDKHPEYAIPPEYYLISRIQAMQDNISYDHANDLNTGSDDDPTFELEIKKYDFLLKNVLNYMIEQMPAFLKSQLPQIKEYLQSSSLEDIRYGNRGSIGNKDTVNARAMNVAIQGQLRHHQVTERLNTLNMLISKFVPPSAQPGATHT